MRLLCDLINVRERPWAFKRQPIDYNRRGTDRLNAHPWKEPFVSASARFGPRRYIARRTPAHSLVQELTISLSFASDSFPVQVSCRRGSIFDEAYTHFVSSAPQRFGAINPSFAKDVKFNGVDRWRSREKFSPPPK
jgi:hypothetical protein